MLQSLGEEALPGVLPVILLRNVAVIRHCMKAKLALRGLVVLVQRGQHLAERARIRQLQVEIIELADIDGRVWRVIAGAPHDGRGNKVRDDAMDCSSSFVLSLQCFAAVMAFRQLTCVRIEVFERTEFRPS